MHICDPVRQKGTYSLSNYTCVCNFLIVTEMKFSHTILLWWCSILFKNHRKRPFIKKVMSSQSWKSGKAISPFCQTGSHMKICSSEFSVGMWWLQRLTIRDSTLALPRNVHHMTVLTWEAMNLWQNTSLECPNSLIESVFSSWPDLRSYGFVPSVHAVHRVRASSVIDPVYSIRASEGKLALGLG